MSERREQQKRDRELRILRAARRLLEAQGYRATGMQDIARRAGLAVGTLYNYFPTKPEIALAIVRSDAASGLDAGESIVENPPDDPVLAVRSLVDSAMAPFARFDRELWRELVGAAMADPELTAGFFAQDLRFIAQLAQLLQKLRARGALRPGVESGRGAVVLYGVYFSGFMAFLASDQADLRSLRVEIGKNLELAMGGLLECAHETDRREP